MIVGIGSSSARLPRRAIVLLLCFVAAFVCYIDRVNISVAVIAMQETFGWSETTKGLVLSSFFLGYLLFQIPSGWLTNRFGGKIVMAVAVAWWSLFTVLTPIAAMISLPALFAARIAMGLGEAATFPAAYNLGARWFPSTERSRFAAIVASGVPAGTVFALLTTGGIVAAWGWHSVFYIFGFVGFIVTAIWLRFIWNNPEDHPRITPDERALLVATDIKREREPTPWAALMSKPAVWALVVNHFCSTWILYMLLSWLPSYFRETQNMGLVSAGMYSAAPWLSMFVVINIAAWAADSMVRRGIDITHVRKGMQIAGLLGASGFLLWARDAGSPESALALMCCALGALGLTWSGFASNHLDIAPRYADLLMGVTNTAGTIPGVIGVAFTGWLIDRTGSYDAPFMLAAAIAVFGALVWAFFATGKRIID